MKNPILPAQYTPYAINTPNGNLFVVEGADFFNVEILETLTGDFNITGSLKLNDVRIVAPDPTNNFDSENNSQVFGGADNFITGTNNAILWGFNSEVSGDKNVSLWGELNQIEDTAQYAAVGGNKVKASHDGSVTLGDQDVSREKASEKEGQFKVDFSGGALFANDTFLNGDLFVDQANSGLFSGNLNVLGNMYHTGSPVLNFQDLEDASGSLNHDITGNKGIFDTYSGISETGFVKKVTADTGFVDITSKQSITGEKHFHLPVVIDDKLIISGDRYVPANYNSTGFSGQMSWEGEYFYLATGEDAWGRVQVAPW